jgi:hypothetical protein
MKRTALFAALLFAIIYCAGQQINQAEYFIDSDPGFGMASPVPIAGPGNDLALSFEVNTGDLAQGFHRVVVRARDDLGRWGHSLQRVIYVFEPGEIEYPVIDRAEYFIDTDPGFGSATPVQVSGPGNNLALSFTANTGELSGGFHRIVVRARDELGRWSSAYQQIFYVFGENPSIPSEVKAVEYFIDEDTGFGMGTPVNVAAPARDVSVEFVVDMDGLGDGDHILYVRVKDAKNRWSQTLAHAFSLSGTGLDDREITSWFRLYPNPNKGDFVLEFGALKYPAMFQITGLSGRMVCTREIYSNHIPVSVDLPEGIYLITVEAGDQCFTRKLVIGR